MDKFVRWLVNAGLDHMKKIEWSQKALDDYLMLKWYAVIMILSTPTPKLPKFTPIPLN
ncbi:MAG: hypothetical protein DHS20C20_32790 [Ardenticatenaceae bacterium]|nr:MAG: hypothetical protein DHS20C20_32790 [Ardenticatenaceae bacterium]